MDKISVFITDDTVEVRELLKEYFVSSKTIEIIGEADNGLDCIESLKKNKVDILLLDLTMPKYDGLYVLDKIISNKIDVNIILTTFSITDDVIKYVSNKGVSYIVLKPFDMKLLEERITSIYTETKIAIQNSLSTDISIILKNIGIPFHIKGYKYMTLAIKMLCHNPEYLGAITKVLYPEIAKEYSSTPTRVERAIRHSIEVAWSRGNKDYLQNIFGKDKYSESFRPTNSEFIATITNEVKNFRK